MSTVNANVTRNKTFVPDANGRYETSIDGLHQLGEPVVTVDLSGSVNNDDIAAAAAIDPLKMAEMSADGLQYKRLARATYDFDVDGGVVANIGLGVTLPDNAVVTRAWYEVITQLTSDGAAEIAFMAEATNDIKAAAVLGTNGTAGFHEGIEDGTAAAFIKTTAARELTMELTVADLTAGKLILFAEYVVTE